ncbi:MAG: hypothetical protein QNJ53_26780 [Pleurocapsa sp. MO_192.B19]|nr:hypothetical protein [Pleurocapsa sp. MO_192.B19]
MNTYKLRYELLATSFVLTFVLVDICPHPNLPPGLLQSTFSHIQQTIVFE